MTPKQKAKKLEAKSQYRHLNKKNKHRDRWGETQQSREEERNRRYRRVPNVDGALDTALAGAYMLHAIAHQMNKKRGKQ